jgi:hypothetical protein
MGEICWCGQAPGWLSNISMQLCIMVYLHMENGRDALVRTGAGAWMVE